MLDARDTDVDALAGVRPLLDNRTRSGQKVSEAEAADEAEMLGSPQAVEEADRVDHRRRLFFGAEVGFGSGRKKPSAVCRFVTTPRSVMLPT